MGIELIYATIVIIIFLIISGYWLVILVNRIYLSRKYKRAAERNLRADPSDYISEQNHYHYQTVISKYVLLILINFTEVSSGVLTYVHMILQTSYPIIDKDSIYRQKVENCTSVNSSMIVHFQLTESSIPLLTTVRALRDVVAMFLVGLVTYLMIYIIGRMRKTGHMNIKKYLCIMSFISLVIILSSYYTFLIILSKLVYLVIITYTYVMFIIYVKRFEQTLLQVAIERLVQYGSNDREMKQYRYFCYTIIFVNIGSYFLFIATYLGILGRSMVSVIFFGKCVFPTNIMPQLIDLETLNNREVTTIFMIFNELNELSSVIACIGVFLSAFPMVFITISIWIRSVFKMIRRKPSMVFRYKNYSDFDVQSSLVK